jgi:Dolichyl-phosphate-mannose-protein mannosyltransferase
MLKYLMNKKFILILLGITLVALALRLGVANDLQAANNGKNAVNMPSPLTDMATYKRLAELISQGDFHDPFYINNAPKYQPFYNSVFLPLIYLTLGYSIWAVLIAQSLLGAATVYLVGLSTAKIWNRQAAIIAALMAAFSQILILYTPYMLVATLQAFWLVLVFYSTISAFKSAKIIPWVTCGMITGCAILSRGNVWFLVPGIVVMAIYSLVIKKYKSKTPWHKTWRSCAVAAIFLLTIILPQVPFAYRNTVLLGRLCGPSSDAPVVLSLGNTPESPPGGREEGWGPGPMEYPQTYAVWVAKDSPISVPTRIWRWFYREPLAFIELNYRKLLLFWDYREIPNNVSLEFALKQSDCLSYGFLGSVFILIPALAGLYVLIWRSLKKRDLKMLLLMYFILAYCLATMAFYILARFRAPLIPLLAILGGIFVNRVWRVCKKDRRNLYIPYILVFCMSTFICFLAYDTYRTEYETLVMREVRPNGISVPMRHGKMMYLDNGPQTFGGWTPMPFTRGTDLKKQFKINKSAKGSVAELELTLIFSEPGEATLRINDKIERAIANRGGAARKTFVISLPSTGVVNIKLVSSTCNVFFIIDTQRNYGRSSINERLIPGEIVCRLFISPSPKKETKGKKDQVPVTQTVNVFSGIEEQANII